MNSNDPVVILAATRTPLGRFQGELSSVKAPSLGSHVIREVIPRAKVSPEDVVPMTAARELNADHERLHVNGGSRALGDPIGATGARLIVTLLRALKVRDLRKSIASPCIGGGEAISIALGRPAA